MIETLKSSTTLCLGQRRPDTAPQHPLWHMQPSMEELQEEQSPTETAVGWTPAPRRPILLLMQTRTSHGSTFPANPGPSLAPILFTYPRAKPCSTGCSERHPPTLQHLRDHCTGQNQLKVPVPSSSPSPPFTCILSPTALVSWYPLIPVATNGHRDPQGSSDGAKVGKTLPYGTLRHGVDGDLQGGKEAPAREVGDGGCMSSDMG